MQLLVYCTLALRDAVTEVEYSSENTGFMNIMPNKVRIHEIYGAFIS
jgi:hypothetical protein